MWNSNLFRLLIYKQLKQMVILSLIHSVTSALTFLLGNTQDIINLCYADLIHGILEEMYMYQTTALCKLHQSLSYGNTYRFSHSLQHDKGEKHKIKGENANCQVFK